MIRYLKTSYRYCNVFRSSIFYEILILYSQNVSECLISYACIIGHFNLLVRIIDLVSDTILCVLILYISGGTYSLNSTPNDRFFEKLFMAIFYLLSEFLPDICWEKIAEEILFVFCFYVWPVARTLAFRLISVYRITNLIIAWTNSVHLYFNY